MSPPRRLALVRTLLAASGSVALVAVAGYGSEGCRSPTQVTVELRTVGALPCTSLKGVAIVVAGSPRDAEAKMKLESLSAFVPSGECNADGRTIGTLVVTPGSDTGAILVRARYSDGPGTTCIAPDYKGCIVSRRSFGFIEHTRVFLPISLEATCVDVPCDVESSCRTGVCISSEALCSENGRCDSPAEPVLGPDGIGTLPDGAVAPEDSGADTSMLEGGKDAPSDVQKDAPPDIDAAGYGNECPTANGTDCNASNQVCCYMGSYFCQTSCTPGYYVFNCLGRKYCNGSFCCGLPNSGSGPLGSSCDTTNGQMCTQNGNHYLCSSDADCPKHLPRCNGTYYGVGTGVTKQCTVD